MSGSMTREEYVLFTLGRMRDELRATPWWRWRYKRHLRDYRQRFKAAHFHDLYGGGERCRCTLEPIRCTIPPHDHGDTCNGWPCAMVAEKLRLAGEEVPGPPYDD